MSETNLRTLDILIRRLHDERHDLLDLGRDGTITAQEMQRLKEVETRIDELEAQEQRLRFPDGHPADKRIAELEALVAQLAPPQSKKDPNA